MPELPWVLDELFLTIQVDWAVDELFLAIQVDWAVDELFLQLNLTRSPFSKLRQILHRLRNSLARQKTGRADAQTVLACEICISLYQKD